MLDTIFTATNIASAIYVAGKSNVANKEQAVTLGLSIALLWGLSASYGYRHTAECEEAHQGLRPARWSPSPRSYHPPPPRPAPPATTAAPPPGQPVPASEAPPVPPAIQRQDDDDPDLRRPSRPRPNAPVDPHPAPWAPHGPEAPWAPHGPE